MRGCVVAVAIVALVGSLALAGCEVYVPRSGRMIIAPPPGRVVVEPPPGGIIVETEPPPLVVETVPPLPGVGFIWIAGYWNWGGHRWVWERGHYERRPHEAAVWHRPMVEVRGGHRYFVPGRWEQPEHRTSGPPPVEHRTPPPAEHRAPPPPDHRGPGPRSH